MLLRALRCVPLLAVAVALAACGGDDNFTPEGFVEAANANGATLTLGDPLTSSDPELEVYALSAGSGGEDKEEKDEPAVGTTGLQGVTGPAGELPSDSHSGGGSLILTGSEDDGLAEYDRCEATLSLLCYRVANVVLVFEALDPEQRAALDKAVIAIGSEEE